MKIILGPREVAGQVSILTKYLKKEGYQARSVLIYKNKYQYPVDRYFDVGNNRLTRFIRKFFVTAYVAIQADVIHCHGGSSYFSNQLDLKLLKWFKKKIVVTFHGSEVRNVEYLYALARKDSRLPVISTNKQQKQYARIRKVADHITVATPDLLDVVNDAIYIPNSVDTSLFEYPLSSPKNSSFTIVHGPTNREIKGTEYIIRAVEVLKNEGADIRLVLIEGMKHEEALQMYQGADLAIDQLIIGWYGVFAIENLALGTPVMAYIRNDLYNQYIPNEVILNTTPETITDDLRYWYNQRDELREKRHASREYALEVHDPKKNIQSFLALYAHA